MKTKKLTPEQKEANKIKRAEERKALKEQQRIENEKNQKPTSEITFTIEWKKSRIWGYNPKLECLVTFKDGSNEHSPIYTASGCGYDKESTVIASAFNDFLKYKLWGFSYRKLKSDKKPYGINAYHKNHRSFAGGIGIDCYYDISKFIGGKFEKLAHGKTFDVYKYTDLK